MKTATDKIFLAPRIVKSVFLLAIVCMPGVMKPWGHTHTVEQGVIGAVAAVGACAFGSLMWNNSYYDAKNIVTAAEALERSESAHYYSILHVYGVEPSKTSRKVTVLRYIEDEYRHSRDSWYTVRDRFALLWFADALSRVVSTVHSKNEQLLEIQYKMNGSERYYTRELCGEREHVQRKIAALLRKLQSLLTFVQSTHEYAQQETECQLQQEREKIASFSSLVTAAHCSLAGISGDFSRECDRFVTITIAHDFELCLHSIIDLHFVSSSCGYTDRLNYAALWYEQRLIDAIYTLQNKYDLVRQEHDAVCLLATYRGSYGASIEGEYNRFMSEARSKLRLLRDIKSSLLNSVFYHIDLSAYNAACYERNVHQREIRARDREYRAQMRELNAMDREHNVRARERRAYRDEQRVHEEQREMARDEEKRLQKERNNLAERERRLSEREANVREVSTESSEENNKDTVQKKTVGQAGDMSECGRNKASDIYHDVVGGW